MFALIRPHSIKPKNRDCGIFFLGPNAPAISSAGFPISMMKKLINPFAIPIPRLQIDASPQVFPNGENRVGSFVDSTAHWRMHLRGEFGTACDELPGLSVEWGELFR